MKRLQSTSLVLASSSPHKLSEYRALLGLPHLRAIDCHAIDPQDQNLETLVRKKAEHTAQFLPENPFFVDHTGLIIYAWKQLPGGLTRLFMDAVGPPGICRMMQSYKESERIARAKTVIGYFHDGQLLTFEGTVKGTIAPEPRANPGFTWDWDSIFIPDGHNETFAQMPLQEKNQISMRRIATDRFKEECLEVYFDQAVAEVPTAALHARATPDPSVTMPTDEGITTQSKILFLAANPLDTSALRLDEELRGIDEALQATKYRTQFDLKQHWAVRVSDIQSLLLRHKPHIVHFSGHGSQSSGILLENGACRSSFVPLTALTTLFELLKGNVRCVILNACYTDELAQAIAEHVDCVVGMSSEISDSAALHFAQAFYTGLGFGLSVKEAYGLGCNRIDLEGLTEQARPKLLAVHHDPDTIVFASEV